MDGTHDVFVTVGTDFHPFNRLIDWVDEWVEHHPARSRVLVQRGTSTQPRLADSVEYLSYADMESAMRDARVVVTHGGPGTIMLALAHAKRPIVVPRLSRLGEHVDDHQLAFASRIEAQGTITLAPTRDRLFELVEGALARPEDAVAAGQDSVDQTVDRFEQLVNALVARRGPGSPRGPRGRRSA